MRRRVISERLRIIACVLGQGARVDNPPGWHGVFWRAGDAMRCDAVRSRRGCQNHRRREPSPEKASAANLQPARACLLGTTTCRSERPLCACPPLLPSPPLPLPLPLPSSQRCPPSTRARTRTRTRLARRRRSPMPDQEAKLLGVSHAGPPPPTLRSFNRCQSCASAREASIRTEFHTRTMASPLQFRMPWRS